MSPQSDQEYAQAHSVYDAKNWQYSGIHDEKFCDRLHELEISIKSQKQSFSDTDQHILLCLFNYSTSLKGSNLKEIDDLDDFFSFFKHYVDELIQAQSMKSQQFFNEMKKMQGRDFFYEVLGDLIENRLVYCGFMTYRTDINRKLRSISLFENTSSLLVYLTIELQKHYKGMVDHHQRMFPVLEEDIILNPEQQELLADVVEEVPVDESFNKARLDELFQYDQKIYKLSFPNKSYFYCHTQGLLDLPGIVQRKMFEVYKYYYLRRTVESFIKKLMDTIITEINKLKKSGPEFNVDDIYRVFQEGSWNKDTLLPWYYWSSVVSDKLSTQNKMKESLEKYYQSAHLLKSFLHTRAKSIEEGREDESAQKEEEAVPGALPVSTSEKLSDINAFLKMIHEKPDFYTFDSLCRLGFNLGIKNKYDSPQNGGYTAFVQFFLEKASHMISKKTNLPYITCITLGSESKETNYYVYTSDLSTAFLQKRDTVANGMGFHYAELFSMPNVPINDQDELDRNVEELVQNREPLFYKLYVSYLKEIFALLVRRKNMEEIEKLFINNKADAPRSLAAILRIEFDQLKRVGQILETKHRAGQQGEQDHVSEQDIESLHSSEAESGTRMKEMQEAMKQSSIKSPFSLLDWLLNLLGLNKKKKRKKKGAVLSNESQSVLANMISWRERLGKAFNAAIDHDLEVKRNNAQAMKNLFGGGGVGSRLAQKDLQDKAFKKMKGNQAKEKKGQSKDPALGPKEILRVVQANILESCGLSGISVEEALERLEDEWNEVLKIASKEELADELDKRRKTVHKKINEVLGYANISISQTKAEEEIKTKANEIAHYPEISGMVKRDDKKIFLEWYISLLIVIVLNKKLA